VADASAFPTASGVNPMITAMVGLCRAAFHVLVALGAGLAACALHSGGF
jgi:choline dehydrogenase-like flavoprotein